ncbi:hypothetical protein [Microvirga guangxiensis]|uniref:Uncharacterized protein n=1 Tax=Microvirga guangxiensis TaxID=549386 RepID=A0A1G5CH42_9HYPH|nr:hypothetical protein [Microvirga guangxiensis]SCY01835.1 hypothetical protein SAMN02927923_00571 [Microvirga guangxiensis]
MRRLLWILAWIGVVLWSLFAWGAYGLLDIFGDVAVRNADIVSDHPETVEWLSWSLAVLRSLGLGAIVFVWGAVSLLILAVPAVIGFVLPRARPEERVFPSQGPRGGAGGYPPGSAVPPRRIERH